VQRAYPFASTFHAPKDGNASTRFSVQRAYPFASTFHLEIEKPLSAGVVCKELIPLPVLFTLTIKERKPSNLVQRAYPFASTFHMSRLHGRKKSQGAKSLSLCQYFSQEHSDKYGTSLLCKELIPLPVLFTARLKPPSPLSLQANRRKYRRNSAGISSGLSDALAGLSKVLSRFVAARSS
jgi:hypothetical protein